MTWTLWRKHLVLFNLGSMHSYVTTYFHHVDALEYDSLAMYTHTLTFVGGSLVVGRMNVLADLIISNNICSVVIRFMEYSSCSICFTLLMRIYKRATMSIYSCPT